MTEMIMKAMQKAGRNVDASTAEGLLKTFNGDEPGEQKTQRFKEIHDMIDEVPKFGNDIPEVDYFAREVAYTYSKPLQKYNNPRGGKFQQVCILYLQMYRWADRQERRRMEDMHTHLLQTAFRHLRARM